MAYRNGTYVAFHAGGTSVPTASDIKYYNMLKAWNGNKDDNFAFINSHEKNYAVRDTSLKITLQNRLKERLNNSKNMLLIIGKTTKFDTDWVPFEITYAIDNCGLPLILVYPGYNYILNPFLLSDLWPTVLLKRIDNAKVKAIHITFNKTLINYAINQFTLSNKPNSALDFYSKETYRSVGINIL